jgi:hypothetical protein
MPDDVELRELRIFLAALVAAMRQTGAQRPGAGVRAGCPLPLAGLTAGGRGLAARPDPAQRPGR